MKNKDLIQINSKIRKEVLEIVSRALHLESIPDTAKQENYSEWDSMAYLAIVTALEEKYKLKVTADNVGHFNSIPAILKEIENGANYTR